jgi:hypothetical protein
MDTTGVSSRSNHAVVDFERNLRRSCSASTPQLELRAAVPLPVDLYLQRVGAGVVHPGRHLAEGVPLGELHRLAGGEVAGGELEDLGVAVVVASQGVDDFHKDVLGNAGTKVAFRCNYPQSKTVAGFLRGRTGQDVAEALEQLSVGQAYVSTPEHAAARKVFMARD